MPVSRLLVYPDPTPEPLPDAPAPFLGLGPIEHVGEPPLAVRGAADDEVPEGAGFATAIGPLGPVRAARWNRQLPASAGAPVLPGAVPGVSPNAEATSS